MSRNITTAEFASILRRQGIANPVEAACGQKPSAKPGKYNARKKVVDGITFDSTREANRYVELKALEATGVIRELGLQPEFILQPKMRVDGKMQRAIVYRADFNYRESGRRVVEDVKGMKTPVYLLKKKLFRAKFSEIDFREVR